MSSCIVHLSSFQRKRTEDKPKKEKGKKVWSQIYLLHRSEYHYLPTAFLYIGDKKIETMPVLCKAVQILDRASEDGPWENQKGSPGNLVQESSCPSGREKNKEAVPLPCGGLPHSGGKGWPPFKKGPQIEQRGPGIPQVSWLKKFYFLKWFSFEVLNLYMSS